MKLTTRERLELSRILKGYNSDKTDEIEIVNDIFTLIAITPEERVKLGINENNSDYSLNFEQDSEFSFNESQLSMLKKLHSVIEQNSRVNMRNLSLCKKLRDIPVKQEA